MDNKKEVTAEIEIALLKQNMQNIGQDIVEIKTDIKTIKNVVQQIPKDDFEKRITRIEKSSNLWKFLSPSLAAAFSSVLTFLLIQYLQSL